MNKNDVKDTFFSKNHSLNCSGKLLSLETPQVMGVINVTPDSFHDGGNFIDPSDATDQAGKLLAEGAGIIDIGGISSRPGAKPVSVSEETDRLHAVVSKIRSSFPDAILSIDTYKSQVVKEMSDQYNIDIVNDITAGNGDSEMIPLISNLNIPYLIMHMQGEPSNMQDNPHYKNITDEIIQFFSEKLNLLFKKGINDVLIDPGFGFGKTRDHNYELLSHIDSFRMFEIPLVAGVSRKSMIQKLLNTNSESALNGTTAVHMLQLERGVNILRVHDASPAIEAIKIFTETRKFRK